MATSTGQLRAGVVTCSDSVSAGRAEDRSGPLAAALLTALGFEVDGVVVVPDDANAITDAVGSALTAGARLVVTTGGTGLGPRDVTIEAVAALEPREVPGLGELMRSAARERVPATDLSRSGGFVVGDALILCLPGSRGGVQDGLAAAGELLRHAIEMLDGGGHPHGGGNPHDPSPYAVVGEAPIALAALQQAVASDDAGAVVTFEGRVRNHDHGRAVLELTYSAHPSAPQLLADAVTRALDTHPGTRIAAAHRIGPMNIGDLAFAVAVSAAHRGQAFQVCAAVVDEVKEILPVWKLQRFADGTDEWVNCA